MKTKAIRNTFLSAVIMMVSGVFFASAQESGETFFDKKRDDSGKMISKIKYEFVKPGLARAVYKYEYTYNDMNRLSMEEFFIWNVDENEWQLHSCLNHHYFDSDSGEKIESEYVIWNKKENKYKEVSEKAVYWYDFSGNIVYHNMSKKNINIFEQFILTN